MFSSIEVTRPSARTAPDALVVAAFAADGVLAKFDDATKSALV